VNKNEQPTIGGMEGLKDQKVVLSAYESSKTKRVVEVSNFKE
jgi:hypothetical protein